VAPIHDSHGRTSLVEPQGSGVLACGWVRPQTCWDLHPTSPCLLTVITNAGIPIAQCQGHAGSSKNSWMLPNTVVCPIHSPGSDPTPPYPVATAMEQRVLAAWPDLTLHLSGAQQIGWTFLSGISAPWQQHGHQGGWPHQQPLLPEMPHAGIWLGLSTDSQTKLFPPGDEITHQKARSGAPTASQTSAMGCRGRSWENKHIFLHTSPAAGRMQSLKPNLSSPPRL